MNILIVRLSAIGDIVMASPVAEAIKRKHPNSTIYWLAQPECATLLNDHPFVDHVIVWPRKEWSQLWKQKKYIALLHAIRLLRRQLQSLDIELAIDLQGLLKSGLMMWLSGAKKRISLGAKEGSRWLVHQSIARDLGDTTLIGSEYRWLCRQLDFPHQPWNMTIGLSEQSRQRAQNIVEHDIRAPFIVLCPFTTRPQKHWIDEHWRALITKLSDAGIKTVMLGGAADAEHAQALSDGLAVINLTGRTSLQEASALIALSNGLIGVDTGLTHMGHAHRKPTLAIFGSTRPYQRSDHQTSLVLYEAMPCAPCKRNPTCNNRFDCMRAISADQVIAQFMTIYKRTLT